MQIVVGGIKMEETAKKSGFCFQQKQKAHIKTYACTDKKETGFDVLCIDIVDDMSIEI